MAGEAEAATEEAEAEEEAAVETAATTGVTERGGCLMCNLAAGLAAAWGAAVLALLIEAGFVVGTAAGT